MTGYYNVWKVDQDLNILINYKPGVGIPAFRGISYNPSNGLTNVVAYGFKEIQVFNLDLNLIRRISTEPHRPMSLTVSSNQLYVGTEWNGIILVYQNEILINQFKACNGNKVTLYSILFDPNGFMATSCQNPSNKLYLFSTDESLTGKRISTPASPRYICFYSKGRFIQISPYQISIYNLILKILTLLIIKI